MSAQPPPQVANPILANLPTTIFEVMSGLARQYKAVNLGQGFPDDPGPLSVRTAAADAVLHGDNQYPPMMGQMALRDAVAAFYRQIQGLRLDSDQVIITCGATEALAASLLALIAPGDEVVIFQPLYDLYAPMVRRAGGQPKFANLRPPLWRLTAELIDEAISDATKLVIFNNPLNPAGIVHSAEELALLAKACVRHDVIAICDEVWEQVVFDGPAFQPLIAFPGMAERTVKIGSAGKMFSLTGWKIGWTVAAPHLTRAIAKAHQFLTFTLAPPLQTAVTFGLETWLTEAGAAEAQTRRHAFLASRDRLTGLLRAEGFSVSQAQGTYFLTLDLKASGIGLDDVTFCRLAVEEAGVVAIPISAFYDQSPEIGFVRLCFAKYDATLDAGAERLAKARQIAMARG